MFRGQILMHRSLCFEIVAKHWMPRFACPLVSFFDKQNAKYRARQVNINMILYGHVKTHLSFNDYIWFNVLMVSSLINIFHFILLHCLFVCLFVSICRKIGIGRRV